MYRARLQFLFALDRYTLDEDSREALIDMVHGAILFASDSELSYTKAIVFLSIYMRVFQLTVSSPFCRTKQLHDEYRKLLLAHAVERPPRSALIFDLADLMGIDDFMINTYFRQLKLILHAFTRRPVLDFKACFPVGVRVPVMPALADMTLKPKPSTPEVAGSEDAVDQKSVAKGLASASRTLVQIEKEVKSPAVQQAVLEPGAGPEIPWEVVRGPLQGLHEKFVCEFEERERHLLGKVKELEIRLAERPLRKVATKRK
jgi:hypothetical protein